MAQATIQKVQNHTVQINDRNSMKMTGVREVGNFSETVIDIITVAGTIILKGTGLNISKLDTDSGELCISGGINSMQYTKTKEKKPLLEGLFR